MTLSARDLVIVQMVLAGLQAWDPSAGEAGLTGAADISHLSEEDLSRGEQLLSACSERDLASALANVEADLAAARRPAPSRARRAS
jgi:hypothetical protein